MNNDLPDFPFRPTIDIPGLRNEVSMYIVARAAVILGITPEETAGQQYDNMNEMEAFVLDGLRHDLNEINNPTVPNEILTSRDDKDQGIIEIKKCLLDDDVFVVVEDEDETAVFWKKV